MTLVAKTLLRTGIHESPQGQLVATPRRVKRWIDQFKKMRQAGIQVPVAWGHQPKAEPATEDEKAERQYWLSKFNAGYLRDLTYQPATGDMRMKIEVPGARLDGSGNLVTNTKLPDNRIVECAIGEVSAAIKENWRDGKGKNWKDVLIHVALTPLPVIAGQDGFKELSMSEGDPAGVIYLGTTTRTRELAAGDEEEEGKDKTTTDEEPDIEVVPDENEAETDVPEVPEPDKAGADAAGFARALEYLRGRDVHLPEDTTPENFIERLCVACHAIEGKESSEEADDAGEPADAAGGQVQEEQQPTMMMSLSTAKTPAEKSLLRREQERMRKALSVRIDRLVKRGMPVHEAKGLREQIGTYELALTETGAAVRRPIEIELAIWEKALPKGKFTQEYLMSNVVEQERPKLDEEEQDEMAKFARERAKDVSRVQ